jgi:arginine deiminase
MEGGDLIFLDEETLLVGIGNRTNRLAVGQLRERTRARGLRTLITIQLPDWAIHLDGTMMIVDRDLAIVHRQSLAGETIVYEEGTPPKRTRPMKMLRQRGFRLVDRVRETKAGDKCDNSGPSKTRGIQWQREGPKAAHRGRR